MEEALASIVTGPITRRGQLAMQVVYDEGATVGVPDDQKEGHAQILFIPLNGPQKKLIIDVAGYQSEYQMIKFNPEATLVVGASTSGKQLRVFDANKGTLIKEFCRGVYEAEITDFCLVPSTTEILG